VSSTDGIAFNASRISPGIFSKNEIIGVKELSTLPIALSSTDGIVPNAFRISPGIFSKNETTGVKLEESVLTVFWNSEDADCIKFSISLGIFERDEMTGDNALVTCENAPEIMLGMPCTVFTIFETCDDSDEMSVWNVFEMFVKEDEITDGISDNAFWTLPAIFVTVVMIGEIYDKMADGNEDMASSIFENNPGTWEINEAKGENNEFTPERTSPTIVEISPVKKFSI